MKIFIAVLMLSFALTSCGFQPMHGKEFEKMLAGGVIIDSPRDAMGQQFKQNLEDRLNPGGTPAKPAYLLKVTLNSGASAIGVARDGTVLRFNVTLNSNYILVRLSDNKDIQSGNIQHVSSYNNQTNQYFSTYISERDATTRGITELSELYRQRIGLLLLKESNL